MANQTTGERLLALKARSGASLAAIARRAGYKGASSLQAFFSPDYNPEVLDGVVAVKLARGLVGLGSPPISIEDITALALSPGFDIRAERYNPGHPPGATLNPMNEIFETGEPTPTLRGRPKDVPVFGTAIGADLQIDAETEHVMEIEQTILELAEAIAYVRRPPMLDDMRKAYALFVAGSSMEPRYRPGDPVFVDPQRPPSIGDDVIVQLIERDADGDGRVVTSLIKTLVRRSASSVELEQYSPPRRFKVAANQIACIHRIIPWREAFF